MSEFDDRARTWDLKSGHQKRAEAVAADIKRVLKERGCLESSALRGLEYGAGTGALSLLLRECFSELTLMDASREMVKVMEEKFSVAKSLSTGGDGAVLQPIYMNLEKEEWPGGAFDVVYALMVMHHVNDLNLVLSRLYDLLEEGGILIVVDLMAEDGSFHGEGFEGHKGFEPEAFSVLLQGQGFTGVQHRIVYTMKKETDSGLQEFPLVMWAAVKGNKIG